MGKRAEQVGGLITHELGSLITKEVEPPNGALITISRVEVDDALYRASVGISVLPAKFRGSVKTLLDKKRGSLQKLLNKRLVMRRVPKINFYIDDTFEQTSEIEEMLDSLS